MKYDSRSFIISQPFDEAWAKLGLDDIDLAQLQDRLVTDPKAGQVIQGSGGLRKVRINLPDKKKGKRGGARVIYVDFAIFETIYLFYVYGKNEIEDITESDKREYKELIAILEKSFENKYGRKL